jgi:hypothetical protein
VASDERSRLHEIVDRLPEHTLGLAVQLLELLTDGSASLRARQDGARAVVPSRADFEEQCDDDDDEDGDAEGPTASPATLEKLAQLTDDELIRLDDLLEFDPDEARRFWRQRFDEDLPDADLVQDGRS